MGAKALYIDKGDAIPTVNQVRLAGYSAIVAKPDPATFATIAQTAADAGVACGILYELDMFWYADQGFDPGNFTKWTPADNDAQIQFLDRFVNGHTVSFLLVDCSNVTRNGINLDGVWVKGAGEHFLDMVRKRYTKLANNTFLYINNEPLRVWPNNQNIVGFIIREKYKLAFPDFMTLVDSGKRPKLPYDDGAWAWWMYNMTPKLFTYAWDKATLYRNLGFTGTVTPDPVIPDPIIPDPVIPPLPGTLEAKIDAILTILNKHFK
jgi:hypothetical protein